MKQLVIVLFFSISIFTHASTDRNFLLRQIKDKSYQIDRLTYTSEAGISNLRDVLAHLAKAEELLARRGNGNPDVYPRCVDFSYEELKKVMSSSSALKKAQDICLNVDSMEILTFIFSNLERTLSRASAIERATILSTREMTGKLDMLEFSFENYNRSLSRLAAIERAVLGVKQTRVGLLNCLEKYFPIHNRTHSTATAMDETFKTCSRF